MNHEQTADLLTRAAARLLQSYFADVENEADSRWDGDAEQAENYRDEAEEVRLLIVECRVAAVEIADDCRTHRRRARRHLGGLLSSPAV